MLRGWCGPEHYHRGLGGRGREKRKGVLGRNFVLAVLTTTTIEEVRVTRLATGNPARTIEFSARPPRTSWLEPGRGCGVLARIWSRFALELPA